MKTAFMVLKCVLAFGTGVILIPLGALAMPVLFVTLTIMDSDDIPCSGIEEVKE